MHSWAMSHSKDGFKVILEEVPWWLPTYNWLLDKTMTLTCHALCCKQPKWTWKVPTGKPKYFDGELDNSLGYALWNFGQKLHNVDYNVSTRVKMIPVDNDTGVFLWKTIDDSWLWEDDEASTTE
jgi:hypothetical protein